MTLNTNATIEKSKDRPIFWLILMRPGKVNWSNYHQLCRWLQSEL